MKARELREMSTEQLEALLRETTEALFRLRIQKQTERLASPMEPRMKRRLIARIKTILNERARQEASAAK
ncbi:MAG: 50S ribosomal protein L29 [Thermogutta sp.]|nr:50S ribosomal protein L29 [Thermogutta sp.]HOP77059.1 50S ribosomal protein L29 [Thermogutta sp.]HPU06602.1 50S ribosomal protein L29 [Thermogutta sp.]HPZ81798.1 50S ribosomal protein L29 [Thermogutta sp.]HQF12748.1 50S ribosomal protein L29 [Thermogutta sp.]